jgi:hypothetical protein
MVYGTGGAAACLDMPAVLSLGCGTYGGDDGPARRYSCAIVRRAFDLGL